mmetsp:Transcript_47288/g.88179  ORF Transcript_47288/g.88179 Transcript_47288/m.88179 type:complete len:315 (-) Transcript_47288:136-1080(-)
MFGPSLPPWVGPASQLYPASEVGPELGPSNILDVGNRATDAHQPKCPNPVARPVRSYNPLARGDESDQEDDDTGSCVTDSSDEEYDEAVERRREYLSRLQRSRQEFAEIHRQQQDLRDYRAEQATRLQMEAQMAALKAELHEQQAWANADADEQLRHARRAEEAAASIARAMDQEHIYGSLEAGKLWAQFAEEWIRFEADPPASITLDNVPWPPDDGRLLNAMALDEISAVEEAAGQSGKMQSSADTAYIAYKRAFRKASLRWHPDKFASKFGNKLCDDLCEHNGMSHREAISTRVQEVVQAINESWEHIQGTK